MLVGETVVTVVMGVGNRLRGDDGVGPYVIDRLQGRTAALLFDCGTAPENYVGVVVAARPDRLLLIDACDFGGQPGEFRFFGRKEIQRFATGLVSTHTLPISLTVVLIEQQLGRGVECRRSELSSSLVVALLGIQPRQVDFGEGLSADVEAALPAIVDVVCHWIDLG